MQKLESLDILALGITHNFNNLLNGIFGYIELAKKQTSPGQKVHHYLESALASFHSAKDLTRCPLTFAIDLPVSDKEPAPTQEKNPAKSLKSGWNILLMDDELFLLELLKEALEEMNYRVELSKNGEEAIQKYTAAMQSGQTFDAVILDLTVHGGMGGKATIEKLLEINPQVKGIASSGYSEDPIFANPKGYGFCGAIKKPYSIENLCEVFERVLGE